eukprot:TRINITY_DN46371_c0_g1_i1.p1 TRINITY_DN46371_c0_g1~~TRINITY_DN46371_c0_g1_i1.p1  ORF type:complete len:485 (-),score=116.68 TRINITY_DN46371_c0_g1_i1:58-1512(-)
MGCVLSEPVKLVRVQRHGGQHYRCGVAEMQGWRIDHEDAHAMQCDAAFGSFWVLDGHGGSQASTFGAPQLAQEFSPSLSSSATCLPDDDCIERGFARVDEAFKKEVQDLQESSGTTVIGFMAMRQKDGTFTVKLLNCGDSRAVLVRGSGETQESQSSPTVRIPEHIQSLAGDDSALDEWYARFKAIDENTLKVVAAPWPLIAETVDHKPSQPFEKARILAADGFVSDGEPARLDGNLAVSRGLGDFAYKGDDKLPVHQQKVSCIPDVYSISGCPSGTICIIACDGVWDVMSSEAVAAFVRQRLGLGLGEGEKPPEKQEARLQAAADLGDVAAELVAECLRLDSRDNITAMIVQLVADDCCCSEVSGSQLDEMKSYDFLRNLQESEHESQEKALQFLKRSGFPPDPRPCATCARWLKEMQMCRCKNVFYCGKECQKKHWKVHKASCAFAKEKGAGGSEATSGVMSEGTELTGDGGKAKNGIDTTS